MFCVSLMRTYFLVLAAEWNVIFNYFKTKCMCVYIGHVLLTAGAHGGKKHWNFRVEVAGNCKPLDVGASTQIWICCKGCVCC